MVYQCYTVKSVLSGNSKRPKSNTLPTEPRLSHNYEDRLSHNAGQKYCRMLQGEHSAILSTFINLPFVIKIFVLSIFERSLKTGFTVLSVFILLSVTEYCPTQRQDEYIN